MSENTGTETTTTETPTSSGISEDRIRAIFSEEIGKQPKPAKINEDKLVESVVTKIKTEMPGVNEDSIVEKLFEKFSDQFEFSDGETTTTETEGGNGGATKSAGSRLARAIGFGG